jgi:N-methylhydantoinase B
MAGGKAGAGGDFVVSGVGSLNPRELRQHAPNTVVDTALPGGGGYGDPFQRDPRAVLDEVVNGYVSVASAERDYGVVVRSRGRPGAVLVLPEEFTIDDEATRAARANEAQGRG